jgi:hypothetical protein
LTDAIDEEQDLEEQQMQTQFDLSELSEAIKVASEGALATKTVATYRRYVKQGMHSWDADFMKFVEGVWEVC